MGAGFRALETAIRPGDNPASQLDFVRPRLPICNAVKALRKGRTMLVQRAIVTTLAVSITAAAGGCASLPEGFEKPQSFAYTDTDDTTLGKTTRALQQGHPGQTGFYSLNDGLDAFVARAVLAQAAERSIDAQYYILRNDLTGKLFIYELLKAADRGVRVRLLVDDLDVAGKDFGAAALDMHPNMEIRVFNPFARNVSRTSQFVTRLGEVERRAHNKSFTADNQVTILGGRNIGNEYFEANPDVSFSDLDVVARGPVARQVSTAFDQYWNSDLAYPISALVRKAPTEEEAEAARARLDAFVEEQADSKYVKALQNSDLVRRLKNRTLRYSWGDGIVVYDPPEKLREKKELSERYIVGQLAPYMRKVDKELIIFSPYFVPGKEGVEFFRGLRERGVRVRILTNSLASNDAAIVHAGYLKYRRAMLRAGVELYELDSKFTTEERKMRLGGSKASLHAKSFVLDRESVFIGSLNLDPRAVYFNTEIGVIFHAPDLAAEMGREFDKEIEKVAFRLELVTNDKGREGILWHGPGGGEQEVFDHEPRSGFWRRFWVHLLSILPVESQL